MMSIKDTLEVNKSKMENLNEKEKEKFNSFNLGKINEKIVLAFLATPIKNAYTNFTKIGEELYEENNDTEIKTCQKMMKILKVNHIPSRKYLFGYIYLIIKFFVIFHLKLKNYLNYLNMRKIQLF